ncbi:MAG: hypothetical protein ABSC06_36895 [Rhodopila sp.]|jgi:hypothetical protein
MCDLTRRFASDAQRHLPKGLAFEIADLVLVKSWAEMHDFRMTVRLDHGAAVDEDYEEVITFQMMTSPLYRSILWRNATAVFIQPLVGRGKQYGSVAAALDSLIPKSSVVLTDIVINGPWPVQRRCSG